MALAVFNSEGNASINIGEAFNVDLVSTSWEHRYKNLKDFYTIQAEEQEGLLSELPKVDEKFISAFKQRHF